MKIPLDKDNSSERVNARKDQRRRRRSPRSRRRSRSPRSISRSGSVEAKVMSAHHFLSQPPTPQGENMYVVWSGDGKPVTVIKAKRASTGSVPGSGGKHTGNGGRQTGSKGGISGGPLPGFGVNAQSHNAHPGGDAGRHLVRTLSSPPKLGRSPKPKLEKEYNTLKTKEHEDQVELRRLRTENRLLRQRIDNLEKETATLADRLIQDQVIRAQKEEEIYVLRRDLSTQKQQYEELSNLYENTVGELREFKEKASVVSSMPTVTESEQLERIQQLSGQLAESKHRETELTSTMKELREQIRDLVY